MSHKGDIGIRVARILQEGGLTQETYTRTELAALLGVSERAIDYYLYRSPTKGQDLVGYKDGKIRYFRRADVAVFLERFAKRKRNRIRSQKAIEEVWNRG